MIDAAIGSILEQGLYRTSSNAIAERAGLTWGVIQYYFGTRERLMLAVLEDGTRRLAVKLQAARLTADTPQGRIEQFFDILASYYGAPEYLAFTQVLINLSHDPRTSAQARETMLQITTAADPELRRLQSEVFAGTGIRSRTTRDLFFHALRGLAMSHLMLDTLPAASTATMHKSLPQQGKMLSHALALLIEEAGPA